MRIRKWHLKAALQKLISVLPYSQKLNFFFQKYITRGLDLTDDLFFDRYGHAIEHINAYQRHQQLNRPLDSVCELGTGWYPIVPFAMYLFGANRVLTTDIDGLCTTKQCIAVAQKYLELHDRGALKDLIIKDTNRLEMVRKITHMKPDTDVRQILAMINIEYVILDVSRYAPDGQFDLVTSNNTFEHIYPHILKQILHNLYNVTIKGGLMSHFIDLSDHYAHMDSSINVYHFLKYEDKQWKWLDNSVQPMNRWRMPDYRRLYAELSIIISEERNRPGDVEQLGEIVLAQKYKTNSATENAITHSYLFSVK
jgi:Methyltransferase domain